MRSEESKRLFNLRAAVRAHITTHNVYDNNAPVGGICTAHEDAWKHHIMAHALRLTSLFDRGFRFLYQMDDAWLEAHGVASIRDLYPHSADMYRMFAPSFLNRRPQINAQNWHLYQSKAVVPKVRASWCEGATYPFPIDPQTFDFIDNFERLRKDFYAKCTFHRISGPFL